MFSFLLFFSSVNRVSSAITFVRRKCRGGAPQKRNLCLKQFPRTTFALCLGNFIRVSGSVSGSYPMGLFMQRGIFNPEYIKGTTTNLQSKTKGQHLWIRIREHFWSDLEHSWQLMNLQRNCKISVVYLLKDKLRATLQFGNGKVWMHIFLDSLWKSQRHNPTKLFPMEVMVAPELVTPFGSRAQRPSTELITLFPGSHWLLQVTGDIKLFLECLEKCRPNPIFCHP